MASREAARVFGGGARLGERGWGADAHAAEAALCVVRGVDQRPRLGLGDPQAPRAHLPRDLTSERTTRRRAGMSSLFSALAPKAEFSFADVVDEVHRLREENALLKGQVALLSQERLNPGSTPAAVAAAPAAAVGAPASESDGALQSLRAELAVNLGANPQEVREAQAKSLAEQLAASREQLGWLQVARDVEVHATGAELHQAEEALLWMRQRQAARQAQADGREALLLQQVAVAQQAQHTAVAESRQQMAASQAALEEHVLALQEELARRDALQEQFGVEEELAEGARQARAWTLT